VHDPTRFNTILRIPMHGKVQLMSWMQIATGYVFFILFGTGADAHNLYKRMLASMGLGRIWPSLREEIRSGSGIRTPNSFITARKWSSSVGSRAKSMLWSSKTTDTDTYGGTTRNNSVVLENIPTRDSVCKPTKVSSPQPTFLKRIFTRPSRPTTILPFSHDNYRNITESATTDSDRTAFGVKARAWASDTPAGRGSEADGVHVIREVHQDHHDREDVSEKDFESKTVDAWV
jgi:pheromone a factor receptor